MKIAARGEMYHATEFEDMRADKKREFLVLEISEELGDEIRSLPPESRHRLQNALLDLLELMER